MRKLALAALFVAAALPGGAADARSYCPGFNPTNPKCWVRGSARADAAVINGSGSINPGLSEIPAAQSISFTGTATVVGTEGVLATYGCSFSGTDLAGSVAEGVGTVAGSCGPISFTTCVFLRIAAEVQVVCAELPVTIGGAVCVFTPTTTNPVTTYDLICAAAYAAA